MKARIVIALLLLFAFVVPGALAEEDVKERGRYIYDDTDQLALESELALNSYLLGMDKKTGYEVVLAFPAESMTTESMTEWYNQKGVGKMTADNGLAIFMLFQLIQHARSEQIPWMRLSAGGNKKVAGIYRKMPEKQEPWGIAVHQNYWIKVKPNL